LLSFYVEGLAPSLLLEAEAVRALLRDVTARLVASRG